MFRKVSNIIVIFLLLLATAGVTISRHYCGEELVSVSVFSKHDSCCDRMDCCHDETFTLKINDDFSVTYFDFDFEQTALIAPVIFCVISEEFDGNKHMFVSSEIPPPPNIHTVLSTLQTYIL